MGDDSPRLTRRRFLTTTAAVGGTALTADAFASVGSGSRSAPAASGAGWPQFAADYGNTGFGADTNGFDGRYQQEAWAYEYDASISASEAQPVVVDDTVYVTTYDGTLLALDFDDGTTQWTKSLPGETKGTVAAHDGVLFVTTKVGVLAIDTDTQETLWQFDHGSVASPTVVPAGIEGVETGRTLDTATVFVVAMKEPGSFDEDGVFAAFALDAVTGEAHWSAETYEFRTVPAYTDGVVVVSEDARDAVTGAKLWTGEAGQFSDSTAVDGRVYTHSFFGTFAYEARTGTKLWGEKGNEQQPPDVLSIPNYTPAVWNGIVYVLVNELATDIERPVLVALDAETGEEQWRYDQFAPNRGGDLAGSPTVVDGEVYVTGVFAATVGVLVFDAETGEVVHASWSEDYLPSGGAPTVVNGRVLYQSVSELPIFPYDAASDPVNDEGTPALVAVEATDESPAEPPAEPSLVPAPDVGCTSWEGSIDVPVTVTFDGDHPDGYRDQFLYLLDAGDDGTIDAAGWVGRPGDYSYPSATRPTDLSLALTEGEHEIRVVAMDRYGQTTETVTTLDTREACGPGANYSIEYEPQTPTADEPVTFVADATGEPEDGTTFEWRFACGDGVDRTGQEVTVTFGSSGTKDVDLEIFREGDRSIPSETEWTTVDVEAR
ncbi:PQQ-binding-like beta-propeller repeat protein [Haloarchaeobius sp. DFWS5]|uniref:outer membrane protein assembly factor BamB family protein n=1 Tax=Haloarchaeobius sp. DFWS5 TaxID=3446114 RepID=UPI003EBDAC0F